jgi:hypothetical protein
MTSIKPFLGLLLVLAAGALVAAAQARMPYAEQVACTSYPGGSVMNVPGVTDQNLASFLFDPSYARADLLPELRSSSRCLV